MTKPKVYVSSQSFYLEPFTDQLERVNKIGLADIIMFTGGTDVNPGLYGEKQGKYTGHPDPGRDEREEKEFNLGIKYGKKFLGICRGAQFLTVMSGGKLIQDVTGHALGGNHNMLTKHGQTNGFFPHSVPMSSTHHQMMEPSETSHVLIAWTCNRSLHYLDGDNNRIPHSGIEPEIVWYNNTNALCIQGHPEIMEPDSQGVKFCQQLVKEYLIESIG